MVAKAMRTLRKSRCKTQRLSPGGWGKGEEPTKYTEKQWPVELEENLGEWCPGSQRALISLPKSTPGNKSSLHFGLVNPIVILSTNTKITKY